ncbi:hypothetical protein ACLB2K_001111 [Fragaria x ananassa]
MVNEYQRIYRDYMSKLYLLNKTCKFCGGSLGIGKVVLVNLEEFDKVWRGLKSCLKELEDLTHCTLFLNE